MLAHVERGAVRIGTALSAGCLAAAALIGLYQIFGRFVLMQAAPWSEPAVRSLLVWMVYLGICSAARSGGMVAVDVLYLAAPVRLRQAMRWFILAASQLFFGVLGWAGAQMVQFVQSQTLAGVGISIAWAYAAIPVGSGLAMIAMIAHHFDPLVAEDHDVANLQEQAL